MPLTEVQTNNLTTAWRAFIDTEQGKTATGQGSTPDSTRTAFTAWVNSTASAARPTTMDEATHNAIKDAKAILSPALPPTPQAQAAQTEGNGFVNTLIAKEKSTLFRLPLLGTRVTTGTLIGAAGGGLLGYFARNLFGEAASEGIMGYLIPAVGVLAGGFIGQMVEDGMNKPAGTGAPGGQAQTKQMTAGNVAQDLTLNVKVNNVAKEAHLIGTRNGNNLTLTSVTIDGTAYAPPTGSAAVVLTGDAAGNIVVGGDTEVGRQNLAKVTAMVGNRAPGFQLVSEPAPGADQGARIETTMPSLTQNDIAPPLATPVVTAPAVNQPSMG